MPAPHPKAAVIGTTNNPNPALLSVIDVLVHPLEKRESLVL